MGSKTAVRIIHCDRVGCSEPATQQVGFRVWAFGTPRLRNNSLSGLTGLVVCDAHRGVATVKDILTGAAKERIAIAVAKMGKALPDFSSAIIECLPIEGKPIDPKDFARGLHEQ
jgi:hypothetical protein